MAKVSKAKKHLTEEEIQRKIKHTVGFWRVRRWMVILHALVDPAPAKDIAKRFGMGKQTVNNLISDYNRYGDKAVEAIGKGQRQKAYLTKKEEEIFLSPFIKRAIQGNITTVSQIHQSLQRLLGHKVHITTTYRLLKRNGWRKIAPRPSHPNADVNKQEEFKKNLDNKLKK